MWRFNLKRGGIPGAGSLFRPFPVIISTLLVCMLVVSPAVLAQAGAGLKGTIIDGTTGAPIEHASVRIEGTLVQVLSSAEGMFSISSVPVGVYRMAIEAVGYRDMTVGNVEILPDIMTELSIAMEPRVYPLGKITVRAERQKLRAERVDVITRKEIEQSPAGNLPELLETVEGVYIQQSGPGGNATIRIRGGTTEQVLVLVDGQKLNASSSGRADINSIPLDQVEAVEIYKGGASAEFGPDALAGAVNIITRPVKISEDFKIEGKRAQGDWHTSQNSLTLTNPLQIPNLSLRLSYSGQNSDGNFDYKYSVSGTGGYDTTYSDTRINNDSESRNFFASGIWRISPVWYWNFSGQDYHAENGLPGRASRQNEFARTEDNRTMITSGFARETSNSKLLFEFGYSGFDQLFVDTQTAQAVYQFNDIYDNDVITLRHSQQYNLFGSNVIRLGAEYRNDQLNHENRLRANLSMGESSRHYSGIYFSDEQYIDLSILKIVDQAAINTALRYDYSRTSKDSSSWADTVKSNSTEYLSPKLGIALTKGDRLSVTARANYGRSFRLPSLNSLFWDGGVRASGNPGLKPERSEHSEGTIELNAGYNPVAFAAGITYFHNVVYDLIVWGANAQGTWTPQNLSRALITGHEEFIELSLLNNTITVRYQNSVTSPLSKSGVHTTDGKYLPLYPGYITRLSAKVKYKYIQGSYSVRLVDRVYTNDANTRYYDGYRIDDLAFGVRFDINHTWEFSSDVALNNIRDVDYETISNYPMPGKDWKIGLGIIFKLSGDKR